MNNKTVAETPKAKREDAILTLSSDRHPSVHTGTASQLEAELKG